MSEWRSVLGFEGLYEISDDGQVRSARGRLRKPVENRPNGYLTVQLRRDLRTHKRYIHRLVLEAFVGPCPPGMECCHRDGDIGNNSVPNLYWGTRKQNIEDMLRHGTHYWARRSHCKNGHRYTLENFYISKTNGQRVCRVCHRESGLKARRRNGAIARGTQTHCINGHAFDAQNTFVDKHGHRFCRTCRRESSRRQRAKVGRSS